MTTIRMIRADDGKTGDIHPNEVEHMKAHGWAVVDAQPTDDGKTGEGIGTDSGDQFSDDQLRAAIKAATGKAPHHKLSREKLIAQFNELNAAA